MNIESLYQIYRQYPSISIDSRRVKAGDLFVALRGANFDGNRYAADALEAGAAYAVVDDPEVATTDRYVVVTDTLETLQALATYHRSTFSIPVIAITGSNGKTTTKELLSAVLHSHYHTHFTIGNYNNHIGVPLTLLAMPEHTEVAVIEMGANHRGEIEQLCALTRPTHGVITNVGKAHLEGFGGLDGVKAGKGELYQYLKAHAGIAFINADQPHLREMAADLTAKIFYTQEKHPSVDNVPFEVKLIRSKPVLTVGFLDEKGELLEATTQLIGQYNFDNIMTAISLGKYFKVPGQKIKAAIEAYVPNNNRSQLVKNKDNLFILDAYNANPSSMEQALLHFALMEGEPKIAILGDMLELGQTSQAEHQAIAALATRQSLDQVILVGKEFKLPAQELGILHFADVDLLRQWFSKQRYRDGLFLLKASRGIALERLLADA